MRQRSLIFLRCSAVVLCVVGFIAARAYLALRANSNTERPRSTPAAFAGLPKSSNSPHSNQRLLPVKGLSLEELTFDPTSVVRYKGEQLVQISDDEAVRVNIEVTTHSNGLLTLTQGGHPTLTIPIYDCCAEDDQFYVFDGDMLKYEFVDFDGDGILGLRVSGALIFRNDQTVLHEWPIEDTYKYIRSEHNWSLRHSNGPKQWVERLREQMAVPVPLPS